MAKKKLMDPDLCPKCRLRGKVIDSRNIGAGARRRRHKCRKKSHPRWTTWQTFVKPSMLTKFALLADEAAQLLRP